MTKYIQALTVTREKKEAEKIARTIVEQRLAGCAQVLGPIMSTYWWDGKVEEVEEWLCIMKSRGDLYSELESTICLIHSYDVPEILAVPVTKGSKSYLSWLEGELKQLHGSNEQQ